MITIKCGVWERRDLEMFLDYAKEKKYEDYRNGKITEQLLDIELNKIKILKNRLKGICKEDYQQSSWRYNRKRSDLKQVEKNDLPTYEKTL